MILTKILVSLQLLHYCSVLGNPISPGKPLVKRAEIIDEGLSYLPTQGKGVKRYLDSAGELEKSHLDSNVQSTGNNFVPLNFKNGEPSGIKKSGVALEVEYSNNSRIKNLEGISKEKHDNTEEKSYEEEMSSLLINLKTNGDESAQRLKKEHAEGEQENYTNNPDFQKWLEHLPGNSIQNNLTEFQKTILERYIGIFQRNVGNLSGLGDKQLLRKFIEESELDEEELQALDLWKSVLSELHEDGRKTLFSHLIEQIGSVAANDRTKEEMKKLAAEIMKGLQTSEQKEKMLKLVEVLDLVFLKTEKFKWIPEGLVSNLTKEEHQALQIFGKNWEYK